MQHGIRETVQMAPGRVGPVFPQAPMPGPSAPAADHVVPEPDSGVAAPPQVPDHADRPTDPDMAYVAAVAAANLAVEGVEDVTRYGLTIPFTRWLFAYKAGLAAEDFAIWIGNGVLDRFLEDESLFGEFLRTPVSEGGVEPLVVEPPHVVVEVGA